MRDGVTAEARDMGESSTNMRIEIGSLNELFIISVLQAA
jgi:hypothetical protein